MYVCMYVCMHISLHDTYHIIHTYAKINTDASPQGSDGRRGGKERTSRRGGKERTRGPAELTKTFGLKQVSMRPLMISLVMFFRQLLCVLELVCVLELFYLHLLLHLLPTPLHHLRPPVTPPCPQFLSVFHPFAYTAHTHTHTCARVLNQHLYTHVLDVKLLVA